MSTKLAALPRTTTQAFEDCPLCAGGELVEVRGRVPGDGCDWRGCTRCGHIFAARFAPDAPPHAEFPPPAALNEAEMTRNVCAAIVERVSEVRGAIDGRWLDVALGNGLLLATAAEFGYEAVGIQGGPQVVLELGRMGYDAREATIENFSDTEGFDVVSLVEALEYAPFPGELLNFARTQLRPGGLLFVCTPNVDSHTWRSLDVRQANPYWENPLRCQQFSREHLYWCLRKYGFEPCNFNVSKRFRAAMEVCAFALDDTPSGRIEADAADEAA